MATPNGHAPHPPLPPDPQVTVTQRGGQLAIESNLTGPQAVTIMRQMLQQAADVALVELVKQATQGPQQVVLAPELPGLRKR